MARFTVRLTPRGGADRIDGVAGGELGARVRAEPVDGAANEALVRLLASALDVPRSTIRIVVGSTGRRKVIDVQGIDADVLRSRWPGLDV